MRAIIRSQKKHCFIVVCCDDYRRANKEGDITTVSSVHRIAVRYDLALIPPLNGLQKHGNTLWNIIKKLDMRR